ncbi:MAG: hypothetical protein JJT82_09525 [Legionellaceae bacterium]|nr:hypothetical protein [Legionellaceae bacterium]
MNKWDLRLQEELKKLPVDLYHFVQRCCVGFSVNGQQVIDHLLSVDDEQDIINGDTPADSLQLHIKLWIEGGMPHYSGKQLG